VSEVPLCVPYSLDSGPLKYTLAPGARRGGSAGGGESSHGRRDRRCPVRRDSPDGTPPRGRRGVGAERAVAEAAEREPEPPGGRRAPVTGLITCGNHGSASNL